MLKLDPRKLTRFISWGALAIGAIGEIVTQVQIKREIQEAVQEEVARQLATEEDEES